MPKRGNWLLQFVDRGIKTMIRDTQYGYLTFPYKFKSGETVVSTAPITVGKEGNISWRGRKGPLTKSGGKIIVKDLLSVPPGTVAAVTRAMNEMAGKVGGAEVQTASMTKEVKVEQAKANDEELARRLRLLGLNK